MNTAQDQQDQIDKLQALLETVQRNRLQPRVSESTRPERSRSLVPPGVRTESVRPDESLELDLAEELVAAPLGPPTEPAPHTFSSPPAEVEELALEIHAPPLSAPPVSTSSVEEVIARETTRIPSTPPAAPLPEAIAAPPPFASSAVATFVPPPEPARATFGDLLRRTCQLRVVLRH